MRDLVSGLSLTGLSVAPTNATSTGTHTITLMIYAGTTLVNTINAPVSIS
jgi:hypothetical protein